jgi:hypothetical protein
MTYASKAEFDEARGEDEHARDVAGLPPRRRAYNYGDELEAYKTHLDEEIVVLRDALAVAEAKRARLDRVEVDFDADPSVDPRRPGVDASMFSGSMGTDVAEQFRPREEIVPRQIADVPVAGERV